MARSVAAIPQIEQQLHASSGAISLSLALFIFLQGCVPLVWTTLSEFWGRKVSRTFSMTCLWYPIGDGMLQRVYLLSTALCFVGCVVCALAKSIGVLIGMRCVQAIGYVRSSP